jgi:hypothetical protein
MEPSITPVSDLPFAQMRGSARSLAQSRDQIALRLTAEILPFWPRSRSNPIF